MPITSYLFGLLVYFYVVARSGGQLDCGSRYYFATNEYRYITFMHNGTDSQRRETCTWTIEAEDYHIVDAEVLTANVAFQREWSCSEKTNNVTAYDGPGAVGDHVLQWCMNEKPKVTSSGKYLTFHLSIAVTLNSGSELRLRFKQEVPPAMCNGTFNSLTRFYVFTSPGYPNSLKKNQTCSILLSTSSRYVLKLSVLDADIGSTCIYIYDGSNQTSPLLTSVCATHVLTVSSSGSRLLVEFSTGDNPTGKGFKIKYRSISKIYDCPSRAIKVHGSNIMNIKSPYHPANYPNNADCTWTIEGQNDRSVINIRIEDFELEDSPDCTADYLQIYKGSVLDSSIGKWCDNRKPPVYQSVGRHVTIKFHSNGRIAKSGFRLEYWAEISDSASPGLNYGILVGCLVGLIILISCICCCLVYRRRKERLARQGSNPSPQQNIQLFRARNPQSQRSAQTDHPQIAQQQTVSTNGKDTPAQNTIPANFLKPPSYDDVIAMDGSSPSPPPYSAEAVSSDPRNSTSEVNNDQTNSGATDVQTQL